jgi:hypothetical protein
MFDDGSVCSANEAPKENTRKDITFGFAQYGLIVPQLAYKPHFWVSLQGSFA